MELLWISVLVVILFINIYFIFEDIYLEKYKKTNSIKSFFVYLSGRTEKARHTKFSSHNKANIKTITNTLVLCIILFFLAMLVFKTIGFSIVLSIFGLCYPKIHNDSNKKRRISLINMQLRDALNSITSSLKAGLSINSAIIRCVTDLERIYKFNKEKPILEEFIKIKSDLDLGISIDEALVNFSNRVRVEDISDFVDSIVIVRQKGGDLVEVMNNTATIINAKISIKKEIRRLTASKKMESKTLSIIPLVIIILLSLLAPEYMEPLINTILGRILVIFGLILLLMNYLIGRKIVDIKI